MNKPELPKEEIMWAIHNPKWGFYVGTGLTKEDVIKSHIHSIGQKSWKECFSNGDRAIKVKIVPIIKEQP